jgi:predicted RecB family nuclease
VALEPLWIEQVVWSDRHRYAGTVDLVARVEGRLTVVDYKSGKRVYQEAHLQLAAYAAALAEMGHEDCPHGCIVRLPKVAEDVFEVVPCPPRDQLLPVFLHLRAVWAWANEEGGV